MKIKLISLCLFLLFVSACGAPSIPDPTAAPEPTATEALIGKWKTEKSTSAMDDSQTVVLRLRAEHEIQGWLDTFLPVLYVRCKEKKLNVYIATGTQTEVESDIDHSTVRIRFDKEQVVTEKMSHSTDGEALFFKDHLTAFEVIYSFETMLFEFTPFNAPPVQTTFDLRGIKEAAAPLMEACGLYIK